MKIQKTIKNLEANNIKVYYVDNKEDVVPLLKTLISEGDKVAVGGSMTLFETGVIDHLRSGRYVFLDRYQENLTREQIVSIYRDSFLADTYMTSTNAITENGELYNVDGNGNRISALQHGPKSVIVVAGINKIVPDLDAAIHRVKTIAAPKNCVRLNCDTYCNKAGQCVSLNRDNPQMTDGCSSESRICCQYSILAKQRHKDRIKVILVGESLGF
ncbi:MAG: lactate utilization protein [Ruminococcaceae bacterium]|nr:lactate utilization protein [Oscillospiraceae bacterium]